MRSLLSESFCFIFTSSCSAGLLLTIVSKVTKKTLFIRRAWSPKGRFAGENRLSAPVRLHHHSCKIPLTFGQIRFLQSTRYVPFPMFYLGVKPCQFFSRGFFAEGVKLSLSQGLMQRWHKPNLLQNIKNFAKSNIQHLTSNI